MADGQQNNSTTPTSSMSPADWALQLPASYFDALYAWAKNSASVVDAATLPVLETAGTYTSYGFLGAGVSIGYAQDGPYGAIKALGAGSAAIAGSEIGGYVGTIGGPAGAAFGAG